MCKNRPRESLKRKDNDNDSSLSSHWNHHLFQKIWLVSTYFSVPWFPVFNFSMLNPVFPDFQIILCSILSKKSQKFYISYFYQSSLVSLKSHVKKSTENTETDPDWAKNVKKKIFQYLTIYIHSMYQRSFLKHFPGFIWNYFLDFRASHRKSALTFRKEGFGKKSLFRSAV